MRKYLRMRQGFLTEIDVPYLHRRSGEYWLSQRSTWGSMQLPRVHLCCNCHCQSGQKGTLLSNKINVPPQLCSPPLAVLYQFNLDHKQLRSPNEKGKVTSDITKCDLKLCEPSDEVKRGKTRAGLWSSQPQALAGEDHEKKTLCLVIGL